MKDTLAKTLAILALSAAFGSAHGQAPPPPGGAPDRAGDARPAAPARPPRNAVHDGLGWVLQPRVRDELRLTHEQVERIRALVPAPPPRRPDGPTPVDRSRDARGPAGPGGTATPPPAGDPENGPQGGGPVAPGSDAAAPRDQGDPSEDRLRGVLRPEQLARFRQLRLQREHLGALARPGIADELGLTAEQRAKLGQMLGRPFDFEEGPEAGGPGAPPPDAGRPLPPDGARPPVGGGTPPTTGGGNPPARA